MIRGWLCWRGWIDFFVEVDVGIKARIEGVIARLKVGLFERDEHVAVLLLAALAGSNAFLLGPPGTAKSLLARRIAEAFDRGDVAAYFEYLMNRFSTPEDVFGPVSIRALKEDRYARNTVGYLPSARFAFLDEIWKSSPAILNALLTIINEKKFHNGGVAVDVPLQSLVVASNEVPPEGQGLEALYDRFVVRMYAGPISKGNFGDFLAAAGAGGPGVALSPEMAFGAEEVRVWRDEIDAVVVGEDVLRVVDAVRLGLEELGEDLKVYVSDRRWKNAIRFVRAGAFFCGREQAHIGDALLLRHCLWTTEENREAVMEVVEEAVRSCGLFVGVSVEGVSVERVDVEKEGLEKEITKQLYYAEDEYDCEIRGGVEYFRINLIVHDGYHNDQSVVVYIPISQIKTKGKFQPVDESGNNIDYLSCSFSNQAVCRIECTDYRHVRKPGRGSPWTKDITVSPKILHKKGVYKGGEETVLEVYESKIDALSDRIGKMETNLQRRQKAFSEEIATPFVPESVLRVALEGVQEQLEHIAQQKLDCARIRGRIRREN